ncbi:hypothetical protein SPRG_16476 [Saprolegnia parasitica CBS 223.65]|uniref:Uncharacterized protein n=1 Tax=Saprolegnia parasitica (strain CBS 223.65) TaxID=695850 RepID=A0A067BHW7_SAPPC|nr:hypothetical protein SPRG_16476 [Saprolegnia parasitica CBS 223.65]KDO17994.1 hypothetical protein SPRG_16476 [Saprolegnia parasitica CBS 223.65]|eukprot:XP_012211293.1 hypothetical protein SPRG_16476 [Saprolegnia parasitica CBS 223.65]
MSQFDLANDVVSRLLSHLLKYEETQMAGLETGLGAMKEALVAEIDVLRRRLQPRRYTEAATHDTLVLLQHAQAMLGLPSTTDSLDDQCRQHAAQMDQLHTIRDTVRAEYRNHLDAQLEALRLLKSARDGLELPTYSSLEALESAKNQITDGIAHASSVFQGYQNIVLHQAVATRRPQP